MFRPTFPHGLRAFRRSLPSAILSFAVAAVPALADPTIASLPHGPYRSIDGHGRNPAQPSWGAAGIPLLRKAPNGYADGVSAPSGADRPSAREISNLVVAQPHLRLPAAGPTNFVWLWGQFIDHDLDLTNQSCDETFDIAVPSGDRFFDPEGTGTQVIPLCRSIPVDGTGTGVDNPREQANAITAWIDASNVYGSDPVRAAALRMNDGTGRLRTQPGPHGRALLPFNTFGLPNGSNPGQDPASLFLAGDVRANENLALTALHTLWLREHNYWADRIRNSHDPRAQTDEQIYQLARSVVAAEIQAITYDRFLPELLGRNALPAYTGFHPDVNPGIATEFSTAAYRFGHSMLTSQLARLNRFMNPNPAGNIGLKDAFFNPAQIVAGDGIEPLLRGAARQRANACDSFIVPDVRNFLFGRPGQGGFDLASLNIQRGRDHGLPSYNDLRIAYGLSPKPNLAAVNPGSPLITSRLSAVYGSVDQVDPWVGGLAEAPIPKTLVGQLVRAVLVDQFARARDGDRFFYENAFPPQWVRYFERLRLSDVIRRNTSIRGEIQDDVFRIE